MAIFAPFTRRRATSEQTSGRELPESLRQALPAGFEAVGEALASELDPCAACTVVGRDAARDGADLGEALSGLRATYQLVAGTAPEFTATRAVAVAWSEATLEYLHSLSCEDPLTGLTSLAHVRTRLSEVYRSAEAAGAAVRTGHALVVVEPGLASVRDAEHPFTRALQLVRIAETVRSVFAGDETIGRLGSRRVVVVVRRDDGLGAAVGVLRRLLADLELGTAPARVWIEGLPAGQEAATRLLDELARGS